MRLIIYVIIILTFFQCRPSLEITGLWLHTETITKDNQQFSNFGRQIFDFEKDSLNIISLVDWENINLKVNSNETFSYKIENNKLILRTFKDTSDYKITYSPDRIILTSKELDNDRIILKRLLENDTCEIQKEQFVNKSFRLSSDRYTDSIYFLNDTLLLKCGHTNEIFLQKWKLTNYKGYKFFHIANPLFPGMVAYKYSDSTITLNPYTKKNEELKLTNVISKYENKLLIGTWRETERTIISTLSISTDEAKDSLILEIGAEKIKVTKKTRTQTMNWKTTPDFSRIYFLSNNNHFLKAWQIMEVNNSKLKLRIIENSGSEHYIVVMTKDENGR